MQQNDMGKNEAAAKRLDWVRPELLRLDAGAAESGEAGNLDNSGAQRS